MSRPLAAFAVALTLVLPASPAFAQSNGGGEIFKRKCSMCHGPDGSGKTRKGAKSKLPDLGSAEWQASRTDEQIRGAILYGAPGMPGWKNRLSAEEIDALVAHVRSLGRRPPP